MKSLVMIRVRGLEIYSGELELNVQEHELIIVFLLRFQFLCGNKGVAKTPLIGGQNSSQVSQCVCVCAQQNGMALLTLEIDWFYVYSWISWTRFYFNAEIS